MDVSWIMVIRDLFKVGLHGMAKSSILVRLQWRKSSLKEIWSLEVVRWLSIFGLQGFIVLPGAMEP